MWVSMCMQNENLLYKVGGNEVWMQKTSPVMWCKSRRDFLDCSAQVVNFFRDFPMYDPLQTNQTNLTLCGIKPGLYLYCDV